MTRVVIAGAGIAGLAAAYELQKRGVGPVTLVDPRPRLGGVIETAREQGFTVEGGPDSFITQKPWALELCRELGLEDQLIPLASRRVYLHSGGRLQPLPEGFFLTVPTRVWPFVTSGLISFAGKLRMACDWILPRGKEVDDESLGSFIGRRLGREAVEKIAEPLMGGIYLADADQLSVRAAFPRFVEMEREHRSLIKALRRITPSGTSPFLAIKGGMSVLVERLREKLGPTRIVTGRSVDALEKGRVRVGGEWLEADQVILAMPATQAAALMQSVDGEVAVRLATIKVVSSATVSLGFRRGDIPIPLDASGFVIPKRDRRDIVACTWSSVKFEGRAPEGQALLRCFFKDPPLGGDELLVAAARRDLERIMGIRAEPTLVRVYRWPGANPVYRVGHLQLVEEIERRLPAGVHVTGSSYRGIGLPDCIRDGRRIAEKIALSP